MSFDQIRIGLREQAIREGKKQFVGKLVTFDPGETTGIATWVANRDTVELVSVTQEATWPLEKAVPAFSRALDIAQPNAIVFEVYRVYNWKTDEHANSNVPTLQIIGGLKTLCIQRQIPYYSQTAQTAKQFCTDNKLEAWGFHRPLRHGRDAIRHGAYFLLFGHKNAS